MKRVIKEKDEKLAQMKCELLEIENKALKHNLEQKEEQERNGSEKLDRIATELNTLKIKNEQQEMTILEQLNSMSSKPPDVSMENIIEVRVVNETDVKFENSKPSKKYHRSQSSE